MRTAGECLEKVAEMERIADAYPIAAIAAMGSARSLPSCTAIPLLGLYRPSGRL